MATIRLPNDFKEFLKLLNSANAKYLVIGGYAVAYHGYPRSTVDLDIWIGTNADNAAKILAVVEDFGFGAALPALEVFTEEDQMIRMGIPPLRLEILTTITGVDFDECYDQRVAGSLDGVDAKIISLQDLKRNKAATGRHKDRDDLENLP